MQESVTSMLTYSVRDLLENEEDIKNNLLVCPICSQLVIDPKECSECQNLFCNDCIKSWLVKSKQCPFKCPNQMMQLKDPHRFVKNTIANLVMKCPNHQIGCDKKITNEKLQNHINDECQYTIFKCPNEGCDLKFNKVDIKQHAQQCESRIILCEKCGSKYKPQNNHDCLKEALLTIKQLRLDIDQVQKDNFQTKVELLAIIQKQGEDIRKLQNQIIISSYVCKNNHKLQWTSGCRGKCTQCQSANAMLRFKCDLCKTIYCEKCKPCYLNNKKCPSGHELVYQQNAGFNIECDFCLSHPAVKGIPNWRDKDCDFDACNDCYKKYSI